MVFTAHGLTDRVQGWKRELEMFCLTSYITRSTTPPWINFSFKYNKDDTYTGKEMPDES